MGPAAGLHFAQLLIELNASANQDARHAPFILSSNPGVPSRVDAYLRGGANPAGAIAAELQALQGHGADVGVIICNTAHIYFQEIARRTTLPLINMVENAASHACRNGNGANAIGLLATTATVKSQLYANALHACGGSVVVPDEADQEELSAAIFDSTYGIKATGISPSQRACQAIAGVASRLKDKTGISQLLLGCTELSVAVRTDTWHGFRIIDPVKILAGTCLEHAGIRLAQQPASHTLV